MLVHQTGVNFALGLGVGLRVGKRMRIEGRSLTAVLRFNKKMFYQRIFVALLIFGRALVHSDSDDIWSTYDYMLRLVRVGPLSFTRLVMEAGNEPWRSPFSPCRCWHDLLTL